ncbi:MAG: efflux RND transporter periplasmic adaptor subunit [Spirochaetaceae bacterium]|nr:MAG: efflux RND transporter periplasmic adaptor subunit [Spirochaetaceae bacterium]
MLRLQIIALCLLIPLAAWGQQWTPRGITEPYRDATLSATVSEPVSAFLCAEGQFVEAGTVLLELDREEETLEVDRRRLIAESKAEVTAARQRLETLQLNMKATRQLFESTQSVSREELLERELECKLAEAELEGLLIAEEREELEYRIAQVQLEKRLIRAPFDGIIVKIYPELGENCTPQDPLIRIADITRCRLIVHLEASVSRQVKEQMDVRIRIDGAGNPKILPGTVEYISPVVDPSSGLREVKVLFDNNDGQVNPGMTGTLLLK